jgi:N-acyl-D-amino-acid deacylase
MPRSAALVALLLFAAVAVAKDPPVTGEKVAGFEPIDQAVLDFMATIDATAATVAITKDGKLVYSRGYGYADEKKRKPTPPDALLRIASISKPITAAAVKKFIREKKLDADARAFELIGAKPPGKQKPGDERLKDVTVTHLLEHKGGWDSTKTSDPMFDMNKVEQELGLKRAVKPADVITYMLTQPLQSAPGEKEAYSNFGYCVLGRVLEKVGKKPYMEVVQESVFKPLGIKDIRLGHAAVKKRDPREVWYPVGEDAYPLDVMDSHGGLIASAPALCQFLDAYWVTGNPRERGTGGYGVFFGSLPGTTAMALQRPDEYDAVVLLNARRNKTLHADNDALKKAIGAALDAIAKK